MGIKTLYITEAKGFESGKKGGQVAPLFYDFFVLLFNLRFESHSHLIPTGSL